MICLAIEKLKSKLPPFKDEYILPHTVNRAFNIGLVLWSLIATTIFILYYNYTSDSKSFSLRTTTINFSIFGSVILLLITHLLTWIAYTSRKKRTSNYRLVFGFNALIERGIERNDKVIEYSNIKRIISNDLGIIIEKENQNQRIYISKSILNFNEIKERITALSLNH